MAGNFNTRHLRPEIRLAVVVGIALILSGVGHSVAWLFFGGSWSGPTSIRKPILFGLSAGMTMISMAWILSHLPVRYGDRSSKILFSVAMLVEVALITVQQWRGVPAHFNRATALDAAILTTMDWSIFYVTLIIVEVTWRTLRPLPVKADMALAIRGGMILLTISCLLGFVLLLHGNRQIALGLSPEYFGRSGVMKFPHGVAIHAIQALPILAWLLRRLHVEERDRFRRVASSLAGMAGLMIFSLMQTFSGRSRLDLTTASGSVLAIALLFGLASVTPLVSRGISSIVWRRRRERDGKTELIQ